MLRRGHFGSRLANGGAVSPDQPSSRSGPKNRERQIVTTVNTAGNETPDAAVTPLTGTARVKRGMAEMLKGGVIMDVVTPEQAKIAEDAGAAAVMALERVPADIRAQGGVAR